MKKKDKEKKRRFLYYLKLLDRRLFIEDGSFDSLFYHTQSLDVNFSFAILRK